MAKSKSSQKTNKPSVSQIAFSIISLIILLSVVLSLFSS
jgi:hypothetical protein